MSPYVNSDSKLYQDNSQVRLNIFNNWRFVVITWLNKSRYSNKYFGKYGLDPNRYLWYISIRI